MLIRTTKTAPSERELEPGTMSGPTKAHVDAGSGAGGAGSGATDATPTSRRGWTGMILAIAAIVGVATVTITADGEPGQEAASAAAVSGPAVDSQEFLHRLAEQGYIPPEAVDRELLLLERAVASGDIPAATLDAPAGGTGSLYNPAELLLLIEAVVSGQVPAQALDPDLLERLRDEGRISAAYTARLDGLAQRELGR